MHKYTSAQVHKCTLYVIWRRQVQGKGEAFLFPVKQLKEHGATSARGFSILSHLTISTYGFKFTDIVGLDYPLYYRQAQEYDPADHP